MLIPSLALITILFLLLVWATIRERVMAKEIKLAKQFYAAIWNNAHEFIFLIDKTSHVTKTNYYTVCKMPPGKTGNVLGRYCSVAMRVRQITAISTRNVATA